MKQCDAGQVNIDPYLGRADAALIKVPLATQECEIKAVHRG